MRGWARDGVGALDRPARQRRRRAAGAGRARLHAGRRHRSDLGARPAERLRARTACRSPRRRDCASADPADYISAARWRRWPRTSRAMLELQQRGAITFDYGNNIRAQARQAGVADAFDIPGLRARVHPAAVLRRQGPVPLGRAVGRSGRHSRHRSTPRSRCSRTTSRWPLDRAGARARRVPGTAGAHLLARLRRSRALRAAHQRARARRRGSRRRS